MKLINKG